MPEHSAPGATRLRRPLRKSSAQSLSESASRSPAPGGDRRASILSFSSIDGVAQSLTDDIINPSLTRARDLQDDVEVTNWHSTPLLFALLPALAGVLFKEGAAVVTDLLILSLAAIFMNWSIRLPWDWYYSTQAQAREDSYDEDVILEEEEEDTAAESTSSLEQKAKDMSGTGRMAAVVERQDAAAAKLRKQETFALLSTFILPALAAYLLHLLRGQLSNPSTGLVSDYNLSIFLLVAEIRPSRQLIRLVKRRTLHLQRTVTGLDDPFGSAVEQKTAVSRLSTRIDELEQRLASQTDTSSNGHIAKKADLSDLSSEVKKRYESRIDALERAVRRYEKRTTTLAMVTEQRLKLIDVRLQDTLSLAAAAAQQSNKRGAAARLMDSCVALMLWPLSIAGMLVMLPIRALEDVYARLKALLFGQFAVKAEKRASSRSSNTRVEYSSEKSPLRKSATR